MNKKALVLAVGLALATPTISIAKVLPSDLVGISLGEIQSKSYLNEPFKGFISILFTNIESSKNLKVRLAPESVFKKIGAEKLPILNSLSFKIGVKNNKPTIFITSTQAIQMPFLNFILEIEGPQGSIYQDYTTLLDPKKSVVNTLSSDTQYFDQHLAQQKSSLISSINTSNIITSNKHSHKVKSGDTLSQIAQALDAADISLKNMITAIHQRNPSAFVNNNIDKLKTGAVLYIPTKKELESSNFRTVVKNTLNNSSPNLDEFEKNNYTVKQGDNLSTLTKKLGHKGISFTKMMAAIHSANPHAFSKNKINLLKVGKTLRIPSLKELASKDSSRSTVSINNDPNLVVLDNSKPKKVSDQAKEFMLDGFVIEKGDTLAKITKQIGHKEIPYTKMMHAIYLANPDAFEKNNITTLIEGSIIRLPSIAEVKGIDYQAPNIDTDYIEAIKPKFTTPIKNNNKLDNSSNKKNQALNKLEKRVRELKRDLNKAHSNLSNLEQSLAGKETLLKQQSKELTNLASTLELLSGEPSIDKLISTKEKLDPQTIYPDASFSKNIDKKIAPLNDYSEIKMLKSSVLADTKKNSYIPTEINLALSNKFKSKISEYSQYMSGKELFASILALLFGLALIRYRREIYAYTNISYDHPKYYPPFGEEEARKLLKEKPINYQSTLVDLPSDIHEENKPVFSDTHIKECESLADELLKDLEVKTTVHNDNTNWNELNNACDNYIKEYKESNMLEITDVSNNLIEGTTSELEEMTFELFEKLAEGVTKDNTFLDGANNNQIVDANTFDEFTTLSSKVNQDKLQAS